MVKGAKAGFKTEAVRAVVFKSVQDLDLKTRLLALQSGAVMESQPNHAESDLGQWAKTLVESWSMEPRPLPAVLWRAYIRGFSKVSDPLVLALFEKGPLAECETVSAHQHDLHLQLVSKSHAILRRDHSRLNVGRCRHPAGAAPSLERRHGAIDSSRSLFGSAATGLPPQGWGLHLACRRGLETFVKDEWAEVFGPQSIKPLKVMQQKGDPKALKAGLFCPLDVATSKLFSRQALNWDSLAKLRCVESAALWWPVAAIDGRQSVQVEPQLLAGQWLASLKGPQVTSYIKGLLPGPGRFRIDAPALSPAQLWRLVHLFNDGAGLGGREERAERGEGGTVTTSEVGASPLWLNDPRQSDWQFELATFQGFWGWRLTPKTAVQERFKYRLEDVPASSHGPLAAALARLGAVTSDDVIWDPFCGAGTELIECAMSGPFKAAYGTDLSLRATQAARQNSRSFVEPKFASIQWLHQDAANFEGAAPSLTITNPPLGRRVHRHGIKDFYENVVPKVLSKIPRGGRLVWVTPFASLTDKLLLAQNLHVTMRVTVDLGGFTGEIQRAVKK
jgi:hypothetical protein